MNGRSSWACIASMVVMLAMGLASAMPLPVGMQMPHLLVKRSSSATCRVRPRSNVTPVTGGRVNVGYFTNWGVYGDQPFCEFNSSAIGVPISRTLTRLVDAQNITTDTITHILYA